MTEKFKEIQERLSNPFPIKSLSWRVGKKTNIDKNGKIKDANKPIKALMLVYIDARDVMDRLDEVCGAENWKKEYPIVNGVKICRISIKNPETQEWIYKEDGADDTDFEATKGGLSDAFKRCAVNWGIGRYLYDASKYNTYVEVKDSADYDLYKNNKEELDKVALKISGITKKYLKELIEKSSSLYWLEKNFNDFIEFYEKIPELLELKTKKENELTIKIDDELPTFKQ